MAESAGRIAAMTLSMKWLPFFLCFLVSVETHPLAAQGLQVSGEGIARAQIENRSVNDPSVYAGRVYFIWASRSAKNDPPATGSFYLPYARDPNRREHTLDWYKEKHPTWVIYKSDRTTPAYGFTYATGSAVPLDITNPEVREFYYTTYVQPGVDAGYSFIAFDNVELTNWDQRSGHFDGDGKWVQQFSGERIDDAYAKTVLAWMKFLTDRLHAKGVRVAANVTFPNGKSAVFPHVLQMVELVDLWLDEQGFTLHRDRVLSDEQWLQKFNFVRQVAPSRYYLSVNQMTTRHLADASESQMDWAVANYYLYREDKTLLSVSGLQEYGVFLDAPALHVDLGHALAPPEKDGWGTWTRSYSKGLVIVNPSSKSGATVKLKPGIWVDSHGKEHQHSVELAAISGMMLHLK